MSGPDEGGAGSGAEAGASGGGHSRAHVAPFYCPYCGDEDLVPLEAHGQWACGACRRAFRLSLTAIAAAPDSTSRPARSSAASTTGGEH